MNRYISRSQKLWEISEALLLDGLSARKIYTLIAWLRVKYFSEPSYYVKIVFSEVCESLVLEGFSGFESKIMAKFLLRGTRRK